MWLEANEEKYRVIIPITKTQSSDQIFRLEEKLLESGITFDTGTDFKNMYWELDWSLEGATPEKVIQFLKNNKIEFTLE